jgi:hypothetical protein
MSIDLKYDRRTPILFERVSRFDYKEKANYVC